MTDQFETHPLVSVILPVFNRADTVETAIRSVLAQTYSRVELLVVDDGSTDATRDIVERFASEARLLTQPNRGAYAARNHALAHARGDWIAFLDSDDRWLDKRLETQIRLIERQPEVALVFGNGRLVNAIGHPAATETFFDARRPHRGRAFEKLLEWNFIPTSSVLVRHRCFREFGPFRETRLAADYHKWLQISSRYEIDYTPEVVFEYLLHAEGISRDRAGSYVAVAGHLENLCEELPDPAMKALVSRHALRMRYWAGLASLKRAGALFSEAARHGGTSRINRLRILFCVIAEGLWYSVAHAARLRRRAGGPEAKRR